MQRLFHVISLVFYSSETTSLRKTSTYGAVLGIYGDTVPGEIRRQEMGSGIRRGGGAGGSCDLRSIRAAPVHITQQTGRRLVTREEILLKGTKGRGGTIALQFTSSESC